MKTRSIAFFAFFAVFLFFNPAIINAVPIQFTMTGTGVGTIGGTPFPKSAFTIVSLGDTDSRISAGGDFAINHVSSSISIDGVGTLQILSPTRTFVAFANNLQTVGYARADGEEFDLYDGPKNTAFATWDMLSSIGPIGGTASLFQWSGIGFGPVNTNAGVLIFPDQGSPVTFTATIVPEPSTFALAALGAAALLAARRRFLGIAA
jgi:hypothetical protein